METRSKTGKGDSRSYKDFIPGPRRTRREAAAARNKVAEERAAKDAEELGNLLGISTTEALMRQKMYKDSDPSSFEMPVTPVMPKVPRQNSAKRIDLEGDPFDSDMSVVESDATDFDTLSSCGETDAEPDTGDEGSNDKGSQMDTDDQPRRRKTTRAFPTRDRIAQLSLGAESINLSDEDAEEDGVGDTTIKESDMAIFRQELYDEAHPVASGAGKSPMKKAGKRNTGPGNSKESGNTKRLKPTTTNALHPSSSSVGGGLSQGVMRGVSAQHLVKATSIAAQTTRGRSASHATARRRSQSSQPASQVVPNAVLARTLSRASSIAPSRALAPVAAPVQAGSPTTMAAPTASGNSSNAPRPPQSISSSPASHPPSTVTPVALSQDFVASSQNTTLPVVQSSGGSDGNPNGGGPPGAIENGGGDLVATRRPRQKYTIRDLPLAVQNDFTRYLLPSFLEFAGRCFQDFSFSTDLYVGVLQMLRSLVRNTLVACPDLPVPHSRCMVFALANARAQTWRSGLGNKGFLVVSEYMTNLSIQYPDVDYTDETIGRRYAKYLLKKPVFPFLWEVVDAREDGSVVPISGLFASDLIVDVLALHLQAIQNSRGMPQDTTGQGLFSDQPLMAIAFAAASVERGLKLYAKGYRPPAKGLPQFCEQNFGMSVRQYHDSLFRLQDEDIEYIVTRAEECLASRSGGVASNSDDEDISGDCDARANILSLLPARAGDAK